MGNEDTGMIVEYDNQGSAITKLHSPRADLVDVETTRAQAEVQAGFLMAKQFPRDENYAIERIIRSCGRKTLAEQAIYAFPRGGQQITGPSIRLAEVLAQQWGNINFGYRELAEANGITQVLAYCYDLETNTRSEKVFHVKHTIDTKTGPRVLTSRRDIYEQIANQASRRIRSCILQIIPGDVCETAMEACAVALEAVEGTNIKKRQAKAVEVFKEVGVTEDMIETKFGKKVSALLPADLVVMRRIYQGIRDGISSVADWFETESAADKAKLALAEAVGKKKLAEKKKKTTAKKKAEKAPETEPEPETPPDAPEEPEAEEPAEEPETEPVEEEEEAEPEEPRAELTNEEIIEAVTIDTKGRVSNFAKQTQEVLAEGIGHMLDMEVDAEEAAVQASKAAYNIMVTEHDCDKLGSLPLGERAGFLNSLREWVAGFGGE
jgi:hypothetical protein